MKIWVVNLLSHIKDHLTLPILGGGGGGGEGEVCNTFKTA